jgi:hypothetical protein
MKHSTDYLSMIRWAMKQKRGGRMAKRCAFCGDYLSQLDVGFYECWNEECMMVRDKGIPIEWFGLKDEGDNESK